MEQLAELFRKDGLGVLDRMQAGIAFADRQQNILFANQRFAEMFQTDAESIRRMKCSELMQESPALSREAESREHFFCVRVGGMECHFVMSSTEVADDIVMKVVQEISRLVAQMEELRRELQELRRRVEATIGDVELIPICGVCHKIRLADGSWVYPGEARDIRLHDGLTHGYCPACAQELIEDFRRSQQRMRGERDDRRRVAEGDGPYGKRPHTSRGRKADRDGVGPDRPPPEGDPDEGDPV